MLSVCLPDQRVDLSAIVGAVICHRQQDTFDFQLWVDLPMHLVDKSHSSQYYSYQSYYIVVLQGLDLRF